MAKKNTNKDLTFEHEISEETKMPGAGSGMVDAARQKIREFLESGDKTWEIPIPKNWDLKRTQEVFYRAYKNDEELRSQVFRWTKDGKVFIQRL